jgi:hypothetical protein
MTEPCSIEKLDIRLSVAEVRVEYLGRETTTIREEMARIIEKIGDLETLFKTTIAKSTVIMTILIVLSTAASPILIQRIMSQPNAPPQITQTK